MRPTETHLELFRDFQFGSGDADRHVNADSDEDGDEYGEVAQRLTDLNNQNRRRMYHVAKSPLSVMVESLRD